jgi:hypothetical protein
MTSPLIWPSHDRFRLPINIEVMWRIVVIQFRAAKAGHASPQL